MSAPPLAMTDPAVHLAGFPDLVRRLLLEHRPTATGLCRSCGRPGTGIPHLRHPCPIHQLATRAQLLRTPEEESTE